MQQTERVGFLRLFQIAVAKPKEYRRALDIKKRTVAAFVLFVALIVTVIGILIPMLSFVISIGGPKHFITETLPAFEYKDGTFHIEDRIEIVQNGIRIIADSEVKEFTKDDLEEDTIAEILISRNNLCMKNMLTEPEYHNIDLKDIGSGTFTNEDLVNYVPLFYAGIAFAAGGVFVATIYRYLITALVFAVCARSLARMMKKQLSFGKCYILALMGKAAIEIINSMCIAADFTFVNSILWVFLSFGIVMVYLYFGIKDIGENRMHPEF